MQCKVVLNLDFLWMALVMVGGRSRLGSEYERMTEFFSIRVKRAVANSLIAFSNWSVDVIFECVKLRFLVSSLKGCQLVFVVLVVKCEILMLVGFELLVFLFEQRGFCGKVKGL